MKASEFYARLVKIGDTVLFRGERVTVLNAMTVSTDKGGKDMKVEIADGVWVDVEEIEKC